MEITNFLPFYGRNPVRSTQVSGFRVPFPMEAGKHDTGLTDALFAEDHLRARENGKSELRPLQITVEY